MECLKSVWKLLFGEKRKISLYDTEALFWLADRDIVFFSTYDGEAATWTNGWSVAINCSDTFYYAAADAEYFNPGDELLVKELYMLYGWSGVVAYCAWHRHEEPLERLRNTEYKQARNFIESAIIHGILKEDYK